MAPGGAKTWLEVSSSALRHNIQALRATLEPGVSLNAIVKANAYGHGIKEIVSVALEESVDLFGVDSIDEAEIVRSIAPNATIFIMGATVPERLDDVVRLRAIQTIFDTQGVRALRDAARKAGRPALATLEVETGLHRLGAGGKGLQDVLELLKDSAGEIYVASLASHLSSAEDAAKAHITASQYDSFTQALREVYRKGFMPEHYHIGCSAAGIMHELPHGTCVRFGICLYGLWPSKDARRAGTLGKRHADIKPVLSWKTRIAQVKDVVPGSGVGYGPTFVANRPMRIAVLPVGYYDGFDRGLSNIGSVIIHGTRCGVLGNVCMNMIMVDVSTVPGVLTPDTEVTLLGRDGMNAITADDIAEKLGTINYEVVTRIHPNTPKIIT